MIIFTTARNIIKSDFTRLQNVQCIKEGHETVSATKYKLSTLIWFVEALWSWPIMAFHFSVSSKTNHYIIHCHGILSPLLPLVTTSLSFIILLPFLYRLIGHLPLTLFVPLFSFLVWSLFFYPFVRLVALMDYFAS